MVYFLSLTKNITEICSCFVALLLRVIKEEANALIILYSETFPDNEIVSIYLPDNCVFNLALEACSNVPVEYALPTPNLTGVIGEGAQNQESRSRHKIHPH